MKYLPYDIIHLNLNIHNKVPIPDVNNRGNYLVFWWNEIPLGQLFLKPHTALSEREFPEKIINSIQGSIGHYANLKQEQRWAWKDYLLQEEFEKWNAWMNKVFDPYSPGLTQQKCSVSIIICTRNRASYLKRCLLQLNKLSCFPEEIIVIDNAPTDNSTKDLVQQFDNVKYILESRPGLDFARNTGVLNATMPIVAFVDDDVEVHSHWICRVRESFENPKVAAMTGLIIASELKTEAQFIFEKFWSFNRGYSDKVYGPEYFNENLSKGPPVWEIGAGANMAFRRSIFEEVGYFNELLDVGAAGCNGDSEMWYRILANGHSIYYNPRAIVYHQHRKEIKELKKQIFYYMRGFAAAAMIQQDQQPKAGYKKHLYQKLPRYYRKLIIGGFPLYRLRYRTLKVEIKGVISGLAYYYRNKKHSQTVKLK